MRGSHQLRVQRRASGKLCFSPIAPPPPPPQSPGEDRYHNRVRAEQPGDPAGPRRRQPRRRSRHTARPQQSVASDVEGSVRETRGGGKNPGQKKWRNLSPNRCEFAKPLSRAFSFPRSRREPSGGCKGCVFGAVAVRDASSTESFTTQRQRWSTRLFQVTKMRSRYATFAVASNRRCRCTSTPWWLPPLPPEPAASRPVSVPACRPLRGEGYPRCVEHPRVADLDDVCDVLRRCCLIDG